MGAISVGIAMARGQKLKVFRTPIGFHDAYVAAPSQKAALEAWGTDTNLFARGAAEIVTDETLTREPLENPGQVIKRSRGSLKDQLASLATTGSSKSSKGKEGLHKPSAPPPKRRPKAAVKKRPSRTKLDKAERELAALMSTQAEAENAFRERESALANEREAFDREQERERQSAERTLEKERRAHSQAVGRWLENQ